MKLIKFTPDPLEITFRLKHQTDDNTIYQDVTLKKEGDWIASCAIPTTKHVDPNSAVKNLGEIFYRISQEIMAQAGEFDKIDLSKIQLDTIS